MIDTIIWDLDGTLLDTLDDLHESVNHALKQHGLPLRSRQEIRRFLGNGIRNLIHQSVPDELPEQDFEEVFKTFRTYYMAHSQIKTRPYNCVLETLAKLKTAGYKMAIVSNKVQEAVSDLHRRFFDKYITTAIGESEGIMRKPAPDMVYQALRQLGSLKEHAVYIGDSEVDLLTAQRAEINCISVLWGFRDKDYLIANGAKVFARNPQEIIALLSPSVPSNA